MNSENIQIIATLIVYILIFWSKTRTGVGIKKLKAVLDEHTSKDKVKSLIHTRLEIVTFEKLKHVKIDDRYKNMLVSWSEKFEDFAINSYFSQYRNSNDAERHLESKMGSLLTDIESMLVTRITGEKGGKNIIECAEVEGGISRESEVLVRLLVKNGLSDENYVRVFEDSISRIIDEGLKLFVGWGELK